MMFSGIGIEPIEQKAIRRNIVADAPIPHTEVRKTAEPTGSYKNSPAGAMSNRKLGIVALQITDLSPPMHRLLEGCRP